MALKNRTKGSHNFGLKLEVCKLSRADYVLIDRLTNEAKVEKDKAQVECFSKLRDHDLSNFSKLTSIHRVPSSLTARTLEG